MRIIAAIAVVWVILGLVVVVAHHMTKRAVQRHAQREHMRERMRQ